MKKLLLITLVFVVSLSLAGVALAARGGPRPPASICLNAVGYGVIFALLNKPAGNIVMSDGTEKFYSIQGAFMEFGCNFPVLGSGYVEGNVFHFTLDGTYAHYGPIYFLQAEGFWDVVAHTGNAYVHYSFGTDYNFTLQQVPCTGENIVYSQENQGSTSAPSNQ